MKDGVDWWWWFQLIQARTQKRFEVNNGGTGGGVWQFRDKIEIN
jgi:hypothetical protein